jgi:signal transduction histidine kinase
MSGGGARHGWVVVLLAASVALMAALALQAHAAYVYHRASAEKVLRDFAALAGGEFVRRATMQVGYDGLGVLLPELQRRVGAQGLPAELPALLAAGDDGVRRAAGLARRSFAASTADGRIAFVPDPPAADRVAWILGQVRRPRAAGPFAVAHATPEGRPYTIAFAPVTSAPWDVVGFEVDADVLGEWYTRVVERGPLLPPSLGNGRVTNASLALRVRDETGAERFRAGGGPWAALAVDVPFGSAYSGVLDGSRVEVSIDPAAARDLVIGGLPRSRLPLLLGLLGLSAGLVGVAIVQLRRERALQKLRGEFVASVSHELRTPLTQIRMFAETLRLDRVRNEEERRRALEVIDREATRLTHLVENVLQFSRGERDAVTLVREPRPLAPLVREVVEEFRPLVAGSGVVLRADLDETAEAAVDAGAVRQVLLNLLDNAVKYGPREQSVTVAVRRVAAGVRVEVEDEGPGVPAAEGRRIFDRFQRLERERGSAVAGTGIGLAVARDLVERHGGRVFVEPGARGARFVVELPEAPA